MTPEQNAAYIQTQCACAMIEAYGMLQANNQAALDGLPTLPYQQKDFKGLIEQYGIYHNNIITVLNT